MGIAEEWLNYAPKPRELSGSDSWNVFLSYRSVNRLWVLNLYDVLRGLGHEVFLDQCVLKAGDPLVKDLQKALAASQSGVLIWSVATQDSSWVEREYQVLERMAAEKKEFQFVPVRLDRSSLPLFAQNRIFLDFADYPDGPNGGELLRLVHAIVGKPLTQEATKFAAEQDDAAQRAVAKIKAAIETGNHKRLEQLFELDGLPWQISAVLGCKSAEGLTKLSYNDEAIDMLLRIEEQFTRAIRPKQLRALALARRFQETKHEDDLIAAQDILSELYANGERDPETLGIYGRTWMDRYEFYKDQAALRKSRNLYAEAFDSAQDDYYTGINAAAKSVFLASADDLDKAATYASRVQDIVGMKAWAGDYWKTATVAEACLIQKKYKQAGQFYEAAVDMAPEEIGSQRSTWLQARRLMDKLGPTSDERALVGKAFEHLEQAS
jgi:hypothetical protein